MDTEDVGPHLGTGQIDEEQLVEAPLAYQFRRQTVDGIGRGHHEHRCLALSHPGQQGAEHALAHAAVVVATGQPLLHLVHPQHTGRHLFGQTQRLTQITLGLAEELVVQAGEIQTQQRQAPESSNRLGRQALATALYADQHHAFRRVQELAFEKAGLTFGQPALEVDQPTDFGEACSVVFEAKHALQIQQLELGLVQLRDVFLGDRAVIADHVARQRACLGMAEAAQVLHHLLQGAVVGTHACAAIAFAPTRRLVTHDAQQLVFRRQRKTETSRETLYFGRQLERMRHQHQRRLVRGLAHGDFLEQAHQPGVVIEEGMQVAHHVEVRLQIGLDHAQRRFGLEGRRLVHRCATEAQALQALGH